MHLVYHQYANESKKGESVFSIQWLKLVTFDFLNVKNVKVPMKLKSASSIFYLYIIDLWNV